MLPSKHSLVNMVNRTRREVLEAPANPTSLQNLGEIPHEYRIHKKRGDTIYSRTKIVGKITFYCVLLRFFCFYDYNNFI